jgi:predicted outer membrane protein
MLDGKRISQPRIMALSAAALTVLMIMTGCKAKDTQRTDTTAMGTADTTAMTGMAASVPLTDANIASLVDEVNVADSTLAAAAIPNLTSADVKAFANMMMGEHHALHVQGMQVESAQSITPAAPAADPFQSAVAAEQSALTAATKGAAYDSTYLANEIGIHQAVLAWAGQNAPQNSAYQDYMKTVGTTVQKHLDKATALQQAMGPK